MLMRRMISLFQENTPRLLDDIRGSHCLPRLRRPRAFRTRSAQFLELVQD
jgi:hypothetical protein